MEIYNFNYKNKNLNNAFEKNSTLLIGKFKVFHQGHKELLDKAREISNGKKIGITLFETNNPKEIITIENRINNFAELGFDFVLIIKFDFGVKFLQAKDFIDHIVKKYKVKNIVIGKDFRFGLDRMWGSKELKEYFENTYICETKKINNIKISTSSISEMISTGEIRLINELLLIKYNPAITYVENKMIWNDNLFKPHKGIYFIKIGINNYWYHGLLHISMNEKDEIFFLNYEKPVNDGIYTIQIIQELRIIINSRFDLVKEEDQKKCLEFFYTLQKNNI